MKHQRKKRGAAFIAAALLTALTVGSTVPASAALVEDPTGSANFQSVFNREGTREVGTAQIEAGEFNLGIFGYTQLDPDLVPAGERWAFLGTEKVPAGLNQTYANDYRFTLTNNDPAGEPLTLESWKAQHRVADDFFGETITASIAPGSVYRMPQPEQPLTVQPGETVTVELPAADIPLAAYVAQDEAGQIYEIGSIIRWTFVIEGNEFWFEDRLRIFGGDDINDANAPLFMYCGEEFCETPSVFYERALSGSAFFSDWVEPQEPAQPVEPEEPQPEVPSPPTPPVEQPQQPEQPGQGTTSPAVPPAVPAEPTKPTPGTPTVPELPEALHPSPVVPPTVEAGEPEDANVWTALPQRNHSQPKQQTQPQEVQPQEQKQEPAEETSSFIALKDAYEASRFLFIPLVTFVLLLKGYLWFDMLNLNRLTTKRAKKPLRLNMNQSTELHKLNNIRKENATS